MRGDAVDDLEMLIDSSVYFVATHYNMGIPDVLAMTPEQFEQSFCWAAAAKQVEAEAMEEQMEDMKSNNNGTDIASTKRKGEPFPFE